ncbi:MAG: Ig-like domain-containing protein [Geobacteraceae bacterium]|nr:Ig-like domain-containing protein [Geobacteraceae bacterium]
MVQLIKRHIGQILLDGHFLSNKDLDRALEEQKRTKELLGQVLVRMGVLSEKEVKVPLQVQEHLSHIEDAVKIAAGERQLLGTLLVHSGYISGKQLDQAIAEQKRSGDRLGEVFKRLGLLTDQQLTALLDFQKHQCSVDHTSDGPLRLGELLVATGHISREQLDDALCKQSVSHKKLGKVLVEEGYVRPGLVKYGIHLQKMLVNAALAAILSLAMSGTGQALDVSLQWDPNTEADLAGYKVHYSSGSAALGDGTTIDVQNRTTATITGLDPDKSYNIAVTAYNTSGIEGSYSNVITVTEQVPPTVAISTSADSVSVNGTVYVNVNASDNVGVSKVEYYLNNQLVATSTSSPYVYTWDTTSIAPGAYTLMAKAYDAAGNIGHSGDVSVTVLTDTTAPTVSITSPGVGAEVNGTVTITAASADNVGVSKVEFYNDGVLLYAGNVAPYSYSWDTTGVSNGSHTLTAKAYDAANNVTTSSAYTVSVNNLATAPVPDGNIDGMGGVDIADALLSLQIAVGKVVPTASQLSHGDVAPIVNGKSQPDGKIDVTDVIVILNKVMSSTTGL